MANILYTKMFERMATGNLNWTTAVLRILLERDTSTYTPNKDHDFVGDLTGLVEISVASYARQPLGSAAANIDDANDRVELDVADPSFGALETGQNVKAIIGYVQTGGSDATPADDFLLFRIDTATGLPATLGGGTFSITIDAEGLIQLAQV